MSKGSLLRISRLPLGAGAAVVAGLGAFGVRNAGAMLAFGLCAFTFVAIGSEFGRGSRVYRGRGIAWGPALARTLMRNRRRYGGYIVHLGVCLIVIGLSGLAFRSEHQALLGVDDSMKVGSYTLVYDALEHSATAEKDINQVDLNVFRGGKRITAIKPQLNFHFAQKQRQSEVAIRTNPLEDLYVVVTSLDRNGTAAVRAFVNPLTWWIWMGAIVMALGMSVLLSASSPVAAASRERHPAGAPREVAVSS
jgi:cytochrome c-type biogenesis protein CcmF